MHAVTMAPGHSRLEDKNIRKILVVHEQTNLVLRSSLMIHMKAFDSRHHLAELKAMLRREPKVWSLVCVWRGIGFLLEVVEAFLIILPEKLLAMKTKRWKMTLNLPQRT